ncbi:flagellin [Butyrivibrio sp. FCS014]|nr:flagellin [Butyrivibrio sp. FCS014]
MQKSLDVANIAVTDNGTRTKRLDLINSRLMDQTTTFKTLQSDNEDIDLAEAATQLTTAQITYEASLMATGKISQTSLMNYI